MTYSTRICLHLKVQWQVIYILERELSAQNLKFGSGFVV
jgi:hypothetical protein